MLNSCTCQEQKDMIEKYKVGFNYEPENADSLVKYIEILLDHPKRREEFGANARRLALEKFDRKQSHLEIIKMIDEI